MHVDTERAPVDLRDAKVHEIEELLRQSAPCNVGVHRAERIYTVRRCCFVVQALSHLRPPGIRRTGGATSRRLVFMSTVVTCCVLGALGADHMIATSPAADLVRMRYVKIPRGCDGSTP